MGGERIIAMSRHESRQKLGREFGATDIVTERGDEGVERIKELTNGTGADSVLECVGTQESMVQAIQSARRGGHVGYTSACRTVSTSTARSCSTPTSIFMADLRQCVATCPTSSTWCGTKRSIPARCST